jgi:F0F1-type ATP synthase membrane subunit b/b'
MSVEERRADARAQADEIRRALIEAASTIDGEAVEVVEPPRERKS